MRDAIADRLTEAHRIPGREGVEQIELTEPWKAVREEGASPELISLEPGRVASWGA
jgi:hypothetical protein